MFEKIKERIDWNRANMVAFLYTNKVSYECEAVEWFAIGNENDYYAIYNYIKNNPQAWIEKEVNQKEI